MRGIAFVNSAQHRHCPGRTVPNHMPGKGSMTEFMQSIISSDKTTAIRCGALIVLFFVFASITAAAQDRIYPTVLYSGVNPFTVRASDGIDKIEIYTDDGWKPLVIGQKTRFYKVMTTPIFGPCAREATFRIFVERIDQNFDIEIRVTDCSGSRTKYSVGLENVWTLYHEDFGTVMLGDRPCHTFVVQSNGGDFIVDGVTCASRQFEILFPFRAPPVKLRGTQTYRYSVCFTPLRTGRLKVPVNVLIRREQPAGGYTTYIVADTAYVNVIPAPEEHAVPDPPRPVVIPPVRPRPPKLPPDGPDIPPAPPARVLTAYPLEPGQLPDFPGPEEIADRSPDLAQPDIPEFISDPTTFRTILTPSARSVGKGRGFVGSYDVAGIIAGYGLTDRVTLIAGGLYAPPGVGDALAVSVGGKYEIHREENFRIAAGLQTNFSSTEESDILSGAFYTTANYGNVDRAVNLTAGYSWRRHTPADTGIAPFSRQALLAGVSGDVRFARNWKVAGEMFVIQDTDYQPIAITLRYFDKRFALDAGVAVDLVPEDGLVPLPVLSAVWTW